MRRILREGGSESDLKRDRWLASKKIASDCTRGYSSLYGKRKITPPFYRPDAHVFRDHCRRASTHLQCILNYIHKKNRKQLRKVCFLPTPLHACGSHSRERSPLDCPPSSPLGSPLCHYARKLRTSSQTFAKIPSRSRRAATRSARRCNARQPCVPTKDQKKSPQSTAGARAGRWRTKNVGTIPGPFSKR